MSKASKIYHQKHYISDDLVLEAKIFTIEDLENYPDGFKYSLILINKVTGQRVLMDNHSPKSHHYHLDDSEIEYHFLGIDRLIDDFNRLVFEHLGVKL